MFRSTQSFMRMGHTYRLTSGFRQTLKVWEVQFFKKTPGKYREHQGNLSESKNREKQGIFLACICFFLFFCFIYVLYMFYILCSISCFI